ncbi:hypothetical protein [uncultured Klebsiella sp.]|nr:hypothetical protein [uncultured Klebsiella sp.]
MVIFNIRSLCFKIEVNVVDESVIIVAPVGDSELQFYHGTTCAAG